MLEGSDPESIWIRRPGRGIGVDYSERALGIGRVPAWILIGDITELITSLGCESFECGYLRGRDGRRQSPRIGAKGAA